MGENNLKIFKGSIEGIVKFLFSILLSIINVSFQIILIIGAVCSVILLIKLFPETAILITKPLYSVFQLIFQIIKALLYSILVLCFIYWIILCFDFINVLKKKREINREKFLKDLARKLNRLKKEK